MILRARAVSPCGPASSSTPINPYGADKQKQLVGLGSGFALFRVMDGVRYMK